MDYTNHANVYFQSIVPTIVAAMMIITIIIRVAAQFSTICERIVKYINGKDEFCL